MPLNTCVLWKCFFICEYSSAFRGNTFLTVLKWRCNKGELVLKGE